MRSFIDPFIGNREEKRLERRRRPGFDFIQQGRLQKQAEGQRLRVFTPPLCCCSSWWWNALMGSDAPGCTLVGTCQPAATTSCLHRPWYRRCSNPQHLAAARNESALPMYCILGLPVSHALQAQQSRCVQAQYGSAAVKQRPGQALDDGLDPNSIPVDVNAIPLGARTAKPPPEPVPEVEWWDRALLPGAKGEQQYATSMSEDGQEVRSLLPSLPCAQLPVLQSLLRKCR